VPRRAASTVEHFDYSFADREGRRVRWTQPATADEPAHQWAMTFKTKQDAIRLRRYLERYEGCVSRWDSVIVNALYVNGDFPAPGSASSPNESFYQYAKRQNDANKGITKSSESVAKYRLERACVPLEDGRSLHTIPIKAMDDTVLFAVQKGIEEHRWGKRGDLSYAPTTIRHTMTYILGIIRQAQKESLIPMKAVDRYKLPKAERKQIERALERRDWEGIRKHARSRQQQLLFDLLAASGLRLGEALYLDVRSVQLLRNGKAKVRILGTFLADGSDQDYTKNKTDRDVGVPRGLAEELLAFAGENNRRAGLLFRAVRDERAQLRHQTAEHQFESMVKRAVAAGDVAEWPHHHSYPTPHNLRHSYVTWALSDGRIAPREVARRTGHSMSEMWKTYASSLTGDEAKMDAFQASMDPWSRTPTSAEPVDDGCCAHCGAARDAAQDSQAA